MSMIELIKGDYCNHECPMDEINEFFEKYKVATMVPIPVYLPKYTNEGKFKSLDFTVRMIPLNKILGIGFEDKRSDDSKEILSTKSFNEYVPSERMKQLILLSENKETYVTFGATLRAEGDSININHYTPLSVKELRHLIDLAWFYTYPKVEIPAPII